MRPLNAIAVCNSSVPAILVGEDLAQYPKGRLFFHVFHKSYLNSDPLFIELLPT
jgi:hypothetical protein